MPAKVLPDKRGSVRKRGTQKTGTRTVLGSGSVAYDHQRLLGGCAAHLWRGFVRGAIIGWRVEVPEWSESRSPVVQGLPIVDICRVVARVEPGIEQDKDVGVSGVGVAGELVWPASTCPVHWRERIEVHAYPDREVSDWGREVECGEARTWWEGDGSMWLGSTEDAQELLTCSSPGHVCLEEVRFPVIRDAVALGVVQQCAVGAYSRVGTSAAVSVSVDVIETLGVSCSDIAAEFRGEFCTETGCRTALRMLQMR